MPTEGGPFVLRWRLVSKKKFSKFQLNALRGNLFKVLADEGGNCEWLLYHLANGVVDVFVFEFFSEVSPKRPNIIAHAKRGPASSSPQLAD